MDRLRYWSQKLLLLLHIRPAVVGLEVSDEALRLAYFDGKLWQMHAIRLAPGIMEKGAMKDRAAFLATVAELRTKSKIGGNDNKKKVSVVVSLGSATAYSKVLRLPVIEGENLEKAVALNLEMASPSDASQAYASSQVVGRDEAANQLDVLAAFVDRSLVDDLVDALFSAGFIVMAVEPKSLALTRVFRKKGSGIDIAKPYILISIDNAGLAFFVIRNGAPYFEYGNRWGDIANDKGGLSLAAFEEDLKVNLRQVLNFYAQHWTEPIAAIILSTAIFPDDLEKTITANFPLPAVRLTLVMGQPISPEWLVALGSSLRENDLEVSKTKKEISFLGGELEDRFHAEQMLRFLGFWRVVIPVALGVLVAAFFVANVFLGHAQATIESAPGFTMLSAEEKDLAGLQASTTAFNSSVAMIHSLENMTASQSAILSAIETMADANGIVISRLTVPPGGNAVITLSGTASSEDRVSAFKNTLKANPKITSLNLPLTQIQVNGTNYSFLMTFIYQ